MATIAMYGPAGLGRGRMLAALGLLVVLAGCSNGGLDPSVGAYDYNIYGTVEDNGVTVPYVREGALNPQFERREVTTPGNIPNEPGTIVVDTATRYLYLVEADNKSIRYGIGVGREGFAWSGVATIQAKKAWPRWVPPKEMVARDPAARPYADGMDGGIDNPLGARAMYLYANGKDTLYRLHGTSDPGSIGRAVSSGCVRLINQDVIDLYNHVSVGTKVIVLGPSDNNPTGKSVPVVESLFPGTPPPIPPKDVGQT